MLSVKPTYSRMCTLILALPDLLFFALWCSLQAYEGLPPWMYTPPAASYMLFLCWLCFSYCLGLYRPDKIISKKRLALRTLAAMAGEGLVLHFLLGFGLLNKEESGILFFCILLLAAGLGARLCLLLAYSRLSAKEKSCKRFVILGYTPESRMLKEYLCHSAHSHHFLGYFDDTYNSPVVNGRLEAVQQFCLNNQVNEIYICGGSADYLQKMYDFANRQFIYLYYLHPGRLPQKRVQHLALEEDLSVLWYKPSLRRQWLSRWRTPTTPKGRLTTITH